MVAGDPVDAGEDTGVEPGPGAGEDAHGDEADALGDAIGRSADRAGDVGAVAVAVIGGDTDRRRRVDAVHGAAAELGVGLADAGVDHIGGDTGAGSCVGVRAGERQRTLVGPVDPPGGAGLGRVDVNGAVAFDVGDTGVGTQRVEGGGRDDGRVALEGAAWSAATALGLAPSFSTTM
jgi:hypothetical protein